MKTSENIQDIAKALSAAQGEIKPANKDGANPHFKSKFSTLAAAWESIRIPITSQGLSVLQDITTEEKGTVSVTTRLLHVSGQWIEFGPFCIPITKYDAQGVGSATSYAKRYALCAAVGIVSDDMEDDDGESAVGRNKKEENRQPPRPPQKISADQVHMIKTLESKLDDESKDKLKSYLTGAIGIDRIEDLQVQYFQKILNSYSNAVKLLEQKEVVNA